MAPRFGQIKFNLKRAIEEFEDMNADDLDVMAPPSGPDFRKERQVAGLLDDFLGQLIEDGVFDDCDLVEHVDEDSDEDHDFGYVDSRSTGSSNTPDTTGSRGSRESLRERFSRYIRRIIPIGSSKSSRRESSSPSSSGSRHQYHQRHHNEAERSKSSSRERSGSEPFDLKATYGQAYKTKYPRDEIASSRNSDTDRSADYVEDEDRDDDDDEDLDGEDEVDDEERNSHRLSVHFRQDPEEMSSDGRRSRSLSRSQSQSGSRTSSQSRSRSQSRSSDRGSR